MNGEGLTKVCSFIACAIGVVILLYGVSFWMQGGFSPWPSDTEFVPTATPVPPAYVYEPYVYIALAEESSRSRRHRVSVGAADMNPSDEYEFRVQVATHSAEGTGRNIIGFNRDCSETEWTGESSHSNEQRTDDLQTVVLYVCQSGGTGRITADLLRRETVHDSHTEPVLVRDFGVYFDVQ